MCIDINVSLPTVNKFLLLYPLRFGCIVIVLWTCFRTFICGLIVIIAIPELFLGGNDSFIHYPLSSIKHASSPDNLYYVYVVYIAFLLTEACLFAYAVYNLTVGLYHQTTEPVRQFLVCRFFSWMMELTTLFTLCLIHGILVGWYLILLMFIILEFYGFVIVYSYYRELKGEETLCRHKHWDDYDQGNGNTRRSCERCP